MSIALVQHTSNFGSAVTSLSKAFASSVAAGDSIRCGVRFGNTGATYTISDNVNTGSNYNQDVTRTLATDGDTVIIASKDSTAAGTTTVKAQSSASTTIAMGIAEYSGIAASASLDKTVSANSTGTAANSGNTATTTVANELVYSAMGLAGNGGTVVGSGSTTLLDTVTNTGSGNISFAHGSQIVTVTGTYNGQYTLGTSQEWAVAVATYAAASGGGAGATAWLTPIRGPGRSPGKPPVSARFYQPPRALTITSTDVTSALTGQTATFTVGTITPTISYGLTEQTATFTEGTLSPTASYSITGQSASFIEGILTPAISYGLSAQTATFTEGVLSANLAAALTAQTATFAEGALTPSVDYFPSAQSATFSPGTIASGVNMGLAGQTATFSEGNVVPAIDYSFNGQMARFTEGIIVGPTPPASVLVEVGLGLSLMRLGGKVF